MAFALQLAAAVLGARLQHNASVLQIELFVALDLSSALEEKQQGAAWQ
jgi:hypothetical protein